MRLSAAQVAQFEGAGYLVLPEVIPERVMAGVRAEYAALLDRLYAGWYAAGAVATPPDALDFWGKLLTGYKAGCDYFQPMDISLPGDAIAADTPFHRRARWIGAGTHQSLFNLDHARSSFEPFGSIDLDRQAVTIIGCDIVSAAASRHCEAEYSQPKYLANKASVMLHSEQLRKISSGKC